MILDVAVYFAVFGVSLFMVFFFQKIINIMTINKSSNESRFVYTVIYCMMGCSFLLPVIAMSGLRYGIGTDYFNYERIYNNIHAVNWKNYWTFHNKNIGDFYVEPAYYVLCRIFPSYRLLLWGVGILFFLLLVFTVKDYSKEISIPFALLIYLSTQFIYSLNAIRYALALGFVLLGYNALLHDKIRKYILFVFIGALFHRIVLICLPMIILKKYRYRDVNKIRDVSLCIVIMMFPIISRYLLNVARIIPIFKRYFESSFLMAGGAMTGGWGWKWLLHIVPVLLPVFVFCRKEIYNHEDTYLLFRICIMEIPCRMLGELNVWLTRIGRCAQIAQVIFIPLILSRIKNKNTKIMLYIYYFIWYAFYFTYYAIVTDKGDSLPYVWIFSLQKLVGLSLL